MSRVERKSIYLVSDLYIALDCGFKRNIDLSDCQLQSGYQQTDPEVPRYRREAQLNKPDLGCIRRE